MLSHSSAVTLLASSIPLSQLFAARPDQVEKGANSRIEGCPCLERALAQDQLSVLGNEIDRHLRVDTRRHSLWEMTPQPARSLAEPLAARACGRTKVGTHPPSTWRIVQSEIDPTALRLLVAGAASRRRRFPECDSLEMKVEILCSPDCVAGIRTLSTGFGQSPPSPYNHPSF
jgi:hypothetical protein